MEIDLITKKIKNDLFIIAEIGVNHNGSLGMATKLIDVAKKAGADAVKFQTFKAKMVVSKMAPKAEYQKNDTDDTQLEMVEKYELSEHDYISIIKYCNEQNILFMSTPFDNESADLLDRFNVPLFKIGSGDLTNYHLLKYVASKKKPMIISTGMSNIDEVSQAVDVVSNNGCPAVYLLHCVSCYPTQCEDVNMKSITTMKEKFNIPVGFSDHTNGYHAAIVAVSLGGSILEKHFTLDKNLDGPDHKASASPDELTDYINIVRQTKIMLGNGIKKCVDKEIPIKYVVRRSICINKDMKCGDIITSDSIMMLRPECGIPGNKLFEIIGKTLTCDAKECTFLTKNMVN
jgi:N,N'-diacetyllegionaminate synthase